MPIKNRLKVLRAEQDITQEELARRIGVTRQTIIAIEKEKYEPSLALAFKLSNYFGVPIEGVFAYAEGEHKNGQ